jgi:RNA polymerase sigma factor (sigma-70 family)
LVEVSKLARFEQAILPHLDAAHNLARWLTGNGHDAEDIVQEATLRAFRFFDSFRGQEGRAWLLTVVRNTGYTWLKQNRPEELTLSFDEELHSGDTEAFDPEKLLERSLDRQMLRQALEELPVDFREIVVLRELEGMSYKEIAKITGVPMGTVMSRLARARQRLEQCLTQHLTQES